MTIEQALDFLKEEFGEFLLIARLADEERHVVLAVADDSEGYERLALLVLGAGRVAGVTVAALPAPTWDSDSHGAPPGHPDYPSAKPQEAASDPWFGVRRRYFAVEEMHHPLDHCGVSHHVVARDMAHAAEIISELDLGDAVKLAIAEMTAEQAGMLRVHDYDAGPHSSGTFPLTEAPMGALYSEEC